MKESKVKLHIKRNEDYLFDFLQELRDKKAYGTITIQIKDGEIVLFRHESTIKPEDLKRKYSTCQD